MLRSIRSISHCNIFIPWTVIVVLCLCSYSVSAQDTAILNPLEVSAQKHQNRIELNTEKIRQINPNLRLSQQLQYQSGVFVKSQGQGSLSTISYKGLSATHINISIENASFLSSMNGTMDLNNVHSFHFNQSSLRETTSSLNRANLGPQLLLSNRLENRTEVYTSVNQLTEKTIGLAFSKANGRGGFHLSALSQHSNNRLNLKHYGREEFLGNTGFQDHSLFFKGKASIGAKLIWSPGGLFTVCRTQNTS